MARMPSSPAPLTEAARAFLALPLCATVATLDDDGAPRQTVAWYRLEADDRILLNSNAPRRWCANLIRDPRLALSVIDPADAYNWVGLTGVVEEVVTDVERARDDIVALAHRYRPEGPGEASIAMFRSQPRVSFRVRITGFHDHLEG
jgi:PPOX class probable F420-dependent enzyme